MSNDSLQRLYRFVSWSILFALLVPVFCLVIPDLFRFGKIDLPFLEYVWNHFGTYRYAFPVLFLLYLFLLLLTRKLWVPTLLLTLISTAMGIVNYDLLHTRGTPLVPSDFRQIFHAIGAWRKGYILTKPEGLLAVWIIIFVLWFITLFTRIKKEETHTWVKVVTFLLAVASLVGLFFYFSMVLSDMDMITQLGRVDKVSLIEAFEANGYFPEFFVQILNPTS